MVSAFKWSRITCQQATYLLQFPLSVVQRTDITTLEPSIDAMEVERVLKGRRVSTAKQMRDLEGSPGLTLHVPQAGAHSSFVAED